MKDLLQKILIIFSLMASVQAYAWTGPQGVTFQQNVEFQTTVAAGFQPTPPYSSVWHKGNNTYFVWVDANFRPWVTQITNGKTVTSVPIDSNPDYTAQPDGHHRFSLGVDTDGYVHVTGDMHHYMDLTTSVINPYPLRYQKQGILYWKSNKPNDISGGFTFAGGLNAPTAIPGGGWLLGHFFADNKGVLYYSSQTHAYESLNSTGQMAVGLYLYDTNTKTWTSIGNKVDNGGQPYTTRVYPVFYWELAGLSPSSWFQNYQAYFNFDASNRMHFTVTGTTDSTLSGPNRALYAFSDDGGKTWKRANGSIIPSLPIRGIDSQPSVGDVVYDSNKIAANYVTSSPGVTVDKYGQPGVSLSFAGVWSWFTYNGKTWDNSNSLKYPNLFNAAYGFRTDDNNLAMVIPTIGKILYGTDFQHPFYAYDTGFSNFDNANPNNAYNYGLVYGAAFNSPSTTVSVVSVGPINSPLPAGWSCTDIQDPLTAYLGTCGYTNKSFVSTTFQPGVQWGGTSDRYYYVYQSLTGDHTLIAQVQYSSLGSGTGAGLMIRNSLAANDINVAMIANGNNAIGINYRQKSGSKSVSHALAVTDSPAVWMKMVRAGNTVTMFTSVDGKTWTQLQSMTLALNSKIYIGFVSSAGGSGYTANNATFSNVVLQ